MPYQTGFSLKFIKFKGVDVLMVSVLRRVGVEGVRSLFSCGHTFKVFNGHAVYKSGNIELAPRSSIIVDHLIVEAPFTDSVNF